MYHHIFILKSNLIRSNKVVKLQVLHLPSHAMRPVFHCYCMFACQPASWSLMGSRNENLPQAICTETKYYIQILHFF